MKSGPKTWAALPLALLLAIAMAGDAAAQSRRRPAEPPPPPEPLPSITEQGARCSTAFHAALSNLRDERGRSLTAFDVEARATDPAISGRWLFWTRVGRNKQDTERVCVEPTVRNGRQGCARSETRKIDAAVAGVAPSTDELAVLRALDAFVTDRGAPLEFGSNGRQYVVLQRFTGEINAYMSQPAHPALCNGVEEMVDFHAEKIAGVQKRLDDVSATAGKALALARQRLIWSRDQRMAESRKAVAAAQGVPAASGAIDPAGIAPAPAQPLVPLQLAPVPGSPGLADMVLLAVEGLVPADRAKALADDADVLKRLKAAREAIGRDALPGASDGTRSAAGAALRVIEAAAYGEVQVGKVRRFHEVFLGTLARIRAASRANCTCER